MRNVLYATVLAVNSITAVPASTIVFSNFQKNSLLCECAWGSGRPLGTLPDVPGEIFSLANAFTVPTGVNFGLDRVRLAAGMLSGTMNSLRVDIYSDLNQSPDQLLESFQIDGQMAPFAKDHVPQFADSILHPRLAAGHTYWLYVSTTSLQTGAAWYMNNTSDVGLVGWGGRYEWFCCARLDGRNAFEILGTAVSNSSQPTPEPRSTSLVAAGVLLLLTRITAAKCAVLRRRSRSRSREQ